MLLIQLGSPSRYRSVACGWFDCRSGNSFGSAKLGPRSQQGTNEHSGALESGGGETARRGFWAGCRDRGRAEPVGGRGGRVQTKKGRVRGRGLRSAGAGRRGQSWIPEATDASLGCLRESVSRPRQVGDGMRPGNEAAGPRFLNCRRCPWGVPCACASGLQGTGHLGPREGGWQPACEPQARSGARAEEPGHSRRKRAPFRRS